MTAYVALLRSVNLGPNRLKIDLPGRSDNEGDFTAYYDIDPKTSRPVRFVTTQPGGPRHRTR